MLPEKRIVTEDGSNTQVKFGFQMFQRPTILKKDLARKPTKPLTVPKTTALRTPIVQMILSQYYACLKVIKLEDQSSQLKKGCMMEARKLVLKLQRRYISNFRFKYIY